MNTQKKRSSDSSPDREKEIQALLALIYVISGPQDGRTQQECQITY